jgi:uncharacterized protein
MNIQPEQIERTISLAKEYGATRLILFGSMVTALDQAHDLDLACDGVDGWKLYELGAQLEDRVGRAARSSSPQPADALNTVD